MTARRFSSLSSFCRIGTNGLQTAEAGGPPRRRAARCLNTLGKACPKAAPPPSLTRLFGLRPPWRSSAQVAWRRPCGPPVRPMTRHQGRREKEVGVCLRIGSETGQFGGTRGPSSRFPTGEPDPRLLQVCLIWTYRRSHNAKEAGLPDDNPSLNESARQLLARYC